jgi:lipopolysaccharide/colanic/teichoic acid biosynthesis glycosyltransferase
MSDLIEAKMKTIQTAEKQYIQHIVYRRYVKRITDLILAGLLGIPALLLVGLCYVAIKGETRGPAFFVQERPGYKGRIFRILKLRTMIVETERDGHELSDMERMTKTGLFVRALSLDELPQIWCV